MTTQDKQISSEPSNNQLLSALPADELKKLLPHIKRVFLELRQLIYEPNRPRKLIYFPINSIISFTVHGKEAVVEVCIIGKDGVVGLPVFLEADSWPVMATCQHPGEAWVLNANDFRDFVQQSRTFQRLLHRYSSFLLACAFQTAACNRLHSAEERLCYWLLLTRDLTATDKFPMTHEFLARMLGVRRPTVSLIANALQKSGLIHYRRGTLKILDRTLIEAACCDCYAAVKRERERLFR